jgi:hypothetical protein
MVVSANAQQVPSWLATTIRALLSGPASLATRWNHPLTYYSLQATTTGSERPFCSVARLAITDTPLRRTSEAQW